MSNLILKELGISEKKGKPVVSSRMVAEIFEKRHDNVLRDISALKNDVSKEFSLLNFEESNYKDRGKSYLEILMTKDGFAILTMGFTGKKAMKFKIDYINAFNQMAEFIKSLLTAKLEFPEFTNAIMTAHEEPKHYHFSNELDMINRIVLEKSAKQFRETNGIENGKSIRPYLATEQIKAIEQLQRFDIGLIITQPEFQERKRILTEYFNKVNLIKLISA